MTIKEFKDHFSCLSLINKKIIIANEDGTAGVDEFIFKHTIEAIKFFQEYEGLNYKVVDFFITSNKIFIYAEN